MALTDVDEVVLVGLDRYTPARARSRCPPVAPTARSRCSPRAASCARRPGSGRDLAPARGGGSLNGVADAPGHVVLARELHPRRRAAGSRQAAEGITGVRRVAWPELVTMVPTGGITDSETLGALLHAAVALGRLT